MKPKYYIASKTKHAASWLANRAGGDRITSTWIDEAGAGQTSDHSELAQRCVTEIAEADFLLLYCEPGEIQKGATIEAGIALGLGKEVRCVGTCETISKTFIKHPLWRFFPSVKAAIEGL